MPTYAYACTQCGHRFDAVQSFSDAALTECPVCGGTLRKQYGSVGVTFNGSGFYRTDSRGSKSSTSPAGAKSSEKAAESKPAEAKPAESKPSPAPEKKSA